MIPGNVMSNIVKNNNIFCSHTQEPYDDFHRHLTEPLGLEAERLGQLNFLLWYWQGPLDPIRESLIQIKGYPVQNDFSVEAQYVKNAAPPPLLRDFENDQKRTHDVE